MNPKKQNIINILNLLTLLYRSRKQSIPPLAEEEVQTLRVTKEHLKLAEITAPVFINTIKILEEKGYLVALSIFEDEFHSHVQEFYNTKTYDDTIEQLQQSNVNKITVQQKEIFADYFEKITPANYEFDREKFLKENLTFTDLLDNSKKVLGNHKPEEVSVILLYPFRSIEKLLEKMNEGVEFEEVHDVGFWYVPSNHSFYINGEVIRTIYQGKSNKEHYVLKQLFENPTRKKVYYDELIKFDRSVDEGKELRVFRGAFDRFVNKHPSLKQIFTVHADHVEFHPECFEQT